MPTLKMSIKGQIPYLPPINMNKKQQKLLGDTSIKLLKQQLDAGLDQEGRTMTSYRPGPVYVTLVPYIEAKANHTLKMTTRKLQELRKQGVEVIDARKLKGKKLQKKPRRAIVRNKRTVKFPSYAAYKQALGYPGYRNIKLTGAVQSSLVILWNATGPRSVSIGIRAGKEEAIARGNMKWADWFGLSPQSAARLTRLVDDILADVMKRKVVRISQGVSYVDELVF